MGSVQCLSDKNIQLSFMKILSGGNGDVEQTQNARLKLVTFNCDLDLESV